MGRIDDKLMPLTIFEGPDCSGKSTVVAEYKAKLGLNSRIIHHGPYKGVTAGQLPRFYVDHMMPMLLGWEQQVWDRSWLSEPIYGRAFRKGEDRVGINRRHLERFALRHGAVVVLCLPPWEMVKEKWMERHDAGGEMLDSLDQLKRVYDDYDQLELQTDLTVIRYDYTFHRSDALFSEISRSRPSVHPTWYLKTAGNWNAPVIIVGDAASEPTDYDTVFQVPFASFSGAGCSRWLTTLLDEAGIPENKILWANADQGVSWIRDRHVRGIFALGQAASEALDQFRIRHQKVNHPQHHKRFNAAMPYELIDHILPLVK